MIKFQIDGNVDMKLGQIRKIVADNESVRCLPAEILIKNKNSYLAEVLMYD